MNKKRKICVVTANRAEYSRGRTIIREIYKHPDLEVSLVVMGAHLLEKYGMTIKEIESDGIPVDHRIYMELDGKNPTTMTKSVSIAISDLATFFDNTKPDFVIALTDRYEILAVATAAALMNIRVAHIQGGEVTGTIDESIRHAITKLAHVHFPATDKSKERVIKMGENPQDVFNVGCPATDLLLETEKYSQEETLHKLNEIVIKDEKQKIQDLNKPFILGLQHPVTTEFGTGKDQIKETLSAISRINDYNIIMLWPNIDAGGDDISQGIRNFVRDNNKGNLVVVKHIPYKIYVNLIRNAKVMFGNSSSGMRETCYFGTPTINIGTRQQDRECGTNVTNVAYDGEEIYNALVRQLEHGSYEPEYIYGNGTAGKQIADILSKIEVSVQKRINY